MGFARGGIVASQDAGSDVVPVFMDGCGYMLPAAMVRELMALLAPVPPAHP